MSSAVRRMIEKFRAVPEQRRNIVQFRRVGNVDASNETLWTEQG